MRLPPPRCWTQLAKLLCALLPPSSHTHLPPTNRQAWWCVRAAQHLLDAHLLQHPVAVQVKHANLAGSTAAAPAVAAAASIRSVEQMICIQDAEQASCASPNSSPPLLHHLQLLAGLCACSHVVTHATAAVDAAASPTCRSGRTYATRLGSAGLSDTSLKKGQMCPAVAAGAWPKLLMPSAVAASCARAGRLKLAMSCWLALLPPKLMIELALLLRRRTSYSASCSSSK
jgi:hypothetical protein